MLHDVIEQGKTLTLTFTTHTHTHTHTLHTHTTTHTHTHTHTHTQPVSSEAEQIAQRGSLLDTLLHLLKLTPTSVTQDHPTSLHHHTAGQASLPKFQYKPGDLGLVPAPHTNTQGHSLSHRPHMTELRSGGVDTHLPPLSTSPLTGNSVR